MTKKETLSEILGFVKELIVISARFIMFLGLMMFFITGILYAPTPPQPTTTTETLTFTGTLGMISYSHSFFGIGGVDKTTLNFQNGSDVATFVFDKDLAVTVGNTYTVTYNETSKIYYNFSRPIYEGFQWSWIAILQNAGLGHFDNSTTITPLNVIFEQGADKQ